MTWWYEPTVKANAQQRLSLAGIALDGPGWQKYCIPARIGLSRSTRRLWRLSVKVGDLVKSSDRRPSNNPLHEAYCTGIIAEIVVGHWENELPGYVPGGSTYKVQWLPGDFSYHDESELELISES